MIRRNTKIVRQDKPDSPTPRIVRFFCIALLIVSHPATSQTTHWLGLNSNWSDPVNWDKGVPTDSTTTIISWGSASLSNPFVPGPSGVDTAATGDLTIQSGARLYFTDSPRGILLVHGTVKVQNNSLIYLGSGMMRLKGSASLVGGVFSADSGTITMEGSTWNISSGASFNAGTSTVILDGNGSQTITGNVTFYNLVINNPDTVSISGNVAVNGSLTVEGTTTLVIPSGDSLTVAGKVMTNTTIQGGSPSPIFQLSATSLNLGNVREGTSKTDNVVVSNTGNAPLNILSVTTDNGSFTASPTTATIAASGSQSFVVRYSPTSLGVQIAHIVFAHDGSTTADTLTVSGTGVFPAWSMSSHAVRFGNVPLGLTVADSLYVRNIGTDTLHVDTVRHSNSAFGIAMARPVPFAIPPGDSLKLVVRLATTAAGLFDDTLVFHHDANGSYDTAFISATVIAPMFAVLPSSLSYPNTVVGDSRKDSVVVANSGSAILSIDSVTCDHVSFSVSPGGPVFINPASSLTFTITFSPTRPLATNGSVIFWHNGSAMHDTVKVNGTGIQAGITLTPLSIVYGGVSLGQTKKDSIAIVNTGSAPLTIDSVKSDNVAFVVSPSSGAVIPPSRTFHFTISFSPATLSADSARIVFYHNGPSHQDTVNASGAGIQASFSLSANTLAFGTVPGGQTRVDSVVVTNRGSANLIIDSVKSDNPAFVVTPATPLTVASGSSNRFYVAFHSATPSTVSGNIVFYHNAPTVRDTIKVSGSTATGVADQYTGIPDRYVLLTNFPNPFNPSTTIRFGIPQHSHVRLTIFNLIGQQVAELADEEMNAGYFKRTWNATVASGVYFYRIEAISLEASHQRFVESKKMILMK